MIVERTRDQRLVESVFLAPGVKEQLFDREEAAMPMDEKIIYLAVRDGFFFDGAVDERTIGIVAFLPATNIAWNPHIALLPQYQGKGYGIEAMRTALQWMFAFTPCEKVIAYPPAFKFAMIRVFWRLGFEQEGFQKGAIRWHGELHDRLVMGYSKVGARVVA